jgi:hypothetical protein
MDKPQMIIASHCVKNRKLRAISALGFEMARWLNQLLKV